MSGPRNNIGEVVKGSGVYEKPVLDALHRLVNTLAVGNDAVSVTNPLPVSGTVNGEFTASGLNIGGRVSEVALNDTGWTPLPAVPLANRNAICIQNRSGTEIKIDYRSDRGYIGMVIPANGERFYDITDDIVIYARATAGTPTINIEELA
jgi:hypothetical protein